MSNEEAIAFFKDMNECTYGNLEAVEMAIKALEQEPKTGHWIYDGDQIICNRCFKAFGFISLKLTTNYCPNCGTKMEDEVIVE